VLSFPRALIRRPGEMEMNHLCPLARHGLGSDFLAACPGFAPIEVTLGDGPGSGLNGRSCRHIGAGQAGRGFVAVCRHPDAAHVVPAAEAIAWATRPPMPA
jgi:hypothetical protein